MKTFTTKKSKLLLKKLPLALGCVIATSVYAQNVEQVQAIRKESNLKELNVLRSNLINKTPTVRELRLEAKKRGIPFSGESNGKAFQLKDIDSRTGLPLYYTTYNAGAAEGTQTNKLYSDFGVFDLDGTNMKVHEWDGGAVLTAHQEFEGRATQKDTPASSSGHATHVAGTLIAAGVNPKAKGMAYHATLDAYDWHSDEEEMTAAAADGALVSNHSYGYLGGFEWGDWSGNTGWHWWGEPESTEYKAFGAYLESDRDWDMIAYNAPYYLPIKAAGNPRGDGPEPGGVHYVITGKNNNKYTWAESTQVRQKNGGEDGFDCINNGTVAKNILVVGAAHKLDGEYSKPSDVQMASFSGFGPVDDGRIKPDITGVGVGLTSSWNTGNDAYNSISGTSMASPNVTGSLILLQELYSKNNSGAFMKAATLKALVTGTANDVGNIGPDYSSGWGLLNSFKAAQTIALNNSYSIIKEETLNNGSNYTLDVVASGSEPLKATIAWTDPASPVLSDANIVDDPTKMLINDLDIKVTENGTDYLAWVLDPTNPGNPATKGDNNTDNVEQVIIENPTAGATYTITISHKGNLKKTVLKDKIYSLKDANTQNFGLVVTGINNGVEKDLALTNISTVEDKDFTSSTPVTFTIKNKGNKDFSGAKLKYSLVREDNGTIVVEDEVDLENIASTKSLDKVINLDLSESFVDFTINGEIVSDEDKVDLNNKNAINVFNTVADVSKKGDEYSFGFEEEFNKYGWKSEDINANGKTWYKYTDKGFAHTGESFALNFPNSEGTNDWLFSNPIKVKANTLYRVSFYVRKFQQLPEKLNIAFGNSPESSAMKMIENSETEANLTYKKVSYEFMTSTDPIIYIGFENKVNPNEKSYGIAVDDFNIRFAEGKPDVDFSASNKNPTTYETVTLYDESITASTQPALNYEWTVTPTTFTFMEGTTATSKDLKVKFSDEGNYNVSLKVTNAEGASTEVKDAYIVVNNEDVVAKFTANKTSIYEKDVVTFTNASTGKPEPTTFEWTITPQEGVEFTNSTSTTSKNPIVKFNKSGKYSVKLKATSEHSEAEVTKAEFIDVKGIYNPVRDLAYTFDDSSSDLKLTWKKPTLLPLYEEKFDGSKIPADMTVIDNDNNGYSWEISSSTQSAYSLSWLWTRGGMDVDDWLITSEIQSGGEVLKVDIKTLYAERFDIYVVKAPADGSVPTVDYMINNGHIIYTDNAENKREDFKTMSFDIKNYTDSDFFVAFHHRTTKADNAFALYIDNILVGFDTEDSTSEDSSSQSDNTTTQDNLTRLRVATDKQVLVEYIEEAITKESPSSSFKELGSINAPRLSGYEVVKDGNNVDNKSDINDLVYTENITEKGIYVYDVYAVYKDGTKSEKKTVTVDLSNLSTNDLNTEEELKVYPNPSNGLFNVVAGTSVTELDATVYDLTGKELLKKNFKGNKVELNLTKYPKGVYILNLVDNDGNKKAVKVMIK